MSSQRTLAFALLLCLTLPLASSPVGALAGAGSDLRLLRLEAETPTADQIMSLEETLLWGKEGIGPGSQLLIKFPDASYWCTANFVWKANHKLYLGTAGHCLLPDGKLATHGPGADYDAAGVRTFVCVRDCTFGVFGSIVLRGDLVELGEVAYARSGGIGKDFGLVEIPSEMHNLVRADMPVWGGPTTPASTDSRTGETVCHYGYGLVYGETTARARTGLSIGTFDGSVRYVGAAAGGDSGSALVACEVGEDGLAGTRAAGIVTHVTAGAGGVAFATSIPRAQELARQANLEIALLVEA